MATGLTDPGLVRPRNEDSFLVSGADGFLAVADGMGGHPSGDIASGLAIEAVAGTAPEAGSGSSEYGAEAMATDMAQRVVRADAAIQEGLREPEAPAGMGTTLTLLRVDGVHGRYAIGHVGDSRAYLLRDGALVQLTSDHTWVQRQVDNGIIGHDVAKRHPLRHVLERALMGGETPEVETSTGAIRAGDVFLLCTDGLTGMVADTEILRLMLLGDPAGSSDPMASLDGIATALVDAAKAAGGRDNITVVLGLVRE